MKKFWAFMGVLVLIGSGCLRATTDPATPVAVDSAFVGVDGSLSVQAFNAVAGGFLTWVEGQDVQVDSATVTGLFEAFKGALKGQYPLTDSYQSAIVVRVLAAPERVLQVRSGGPDGALDTSDDLVKHYPFTGAMASGAVAEGGQ